MLRDDPLLVLFAVSGIGYLLGRVRIAGFSLGVSAVLFVGLATTALDPSLRLPEIVYQLGLVLFVYTIAVSSGPGSLSAFRRRGLSQNLLVLGAILTSFALTIALGLALGLGGETTAGIFSGSLTNTPALAAVVEHLEQAGDPSSLPVIAYSLTYPFGVIGVLLAIHAAQSWWHVDLEREASSAVPGAGEAPVSQTILVERDDHPSVGDLNESFDFPLVFSRIKHGEQIQVASRDTVLYRGDLINVIGSEDDVGSVATHLGQLSREQLPLDRRVLDFRRMFVSEASVAGRKIGDLDLGRRFGAVITRVRRGDVDILARDDMVLEPGDRVRIVAPRERMDALSSYFGDSFHALGEVDILTFGIGIALGLLLGRVDIPLPGGSTFELGLAGGPLLVGLALGALQRTGPLVWQMPYSASITIRQIGVVLFLAGIGTRAGEAFADSLSLESVRIVAVGAAVTTIAAFGALTIGYRVLRIPMGLMTGIVAGMQTQPAVLAFATERAGEQGPDLGYATVYPGAMISKILLAQAILLVL